MQIVQACERVLQTEYVSSAASPDAQIDMMQLKVQVCLYGCLANTALWIKAQCVPIRRKLSMLLTVNRG